MGVWVGTEHTGQQGERLKREQKDTVMYIVDSLFPLVMPASPTVPTTASSSLTNGITVIDWEKR